MDNSSERISVIITGICGEIGSNFAKWLSENTDYHIVGLDNLSDGYLDNIKDIRKLTMYIRNAQDDLTDIFEKYNIVYCYSMAAFCSEGLSPFVRKFAYENNIMINANIINHCVKYNCKLIYLSSMSVYGEGISLPFTEDQQCRPVDPYGLAKFLCEEDIKIAAKQHGLRFSIIRPHNVIGVHCNIWSKYRNVIGRFMNQIKNDQPLTIYGDGEQKRAFSWALDYCPMLLKVAENDYSDPIFNIGGDKFYTLNQVANLLFIITGKNTGIQYLEPRYEVKNAYSDHSKAKTVLGFEDKTSLILMLSEMWNWAKVQPNRPVKEWDKFEIENGLYSYWKK